MGAPQVILFGTIDLYERNLVESISNITEQRGFRSGKLWDNSYTLDVDNSDDFFSSDNPKSYFHGYRWLFATLVIYDGDGIKVWDGVITDVKRNHETKRAQLISSSSMAFYANTPVAYTSTSYETPATALRNIFTAVGFTAYDNNTLQQSENVLNTMAASPVRVKVNFLTADTITLSQAIEKIAEVSCAEAFIMDGLLHFRIWENWNNRKNLRGEVSVYVDESDILDFGTVEYALDDMVNQFQIGYYSIGSDDTFETDSTGLGRNVGVISRTRYGVRSLPNLDTGSSTGDDKAIIFENAISAATIGECHIRRTHKKVDTDPVPLQVFRFSLNFGFTRKIDIRTYFRVTYSDEAWTDKLFEVLETTREEATGIINVTALEVEE